MPNQANRRKSDMVLTAPNAQGNVWPKQSCPVFTPRNGHFPGTEECWFCRYADFHLDKPRALDVGVCYWPEKIMD